jgi:hypothetical protein
MFLSMLSLPKSRSIPQLKYRRGPHRKGYAGAYVPLVKENMIHSTAHPISLLRMRQSCSVGPYRIFRALCGLEQGALELRR